MTVDLGQVSDVVAQLVLIAGGMAAGLLWLRRWIKRVASSTEMTATQLTPSNGRTVAEIVEATESRLQDQASQAAQALSVAQSALALAQHVDARVDRHLVGHAQDSVNGGTL